LASVCVTWRLTETPAEMVALQVVWTIDAGSQSIPPPVIQAAESAEGDAQVERSGARSDAAGRDGIAGSGE
jgi:hypothetical protein